MKKIYLGAFVCLCIFTALIAAGPKETVIATELPKVATPDFPVPEEEQPYDPIIEAYDEMLTDGRGSEIVSAPAPFKYGVNFISSAEYPATSQRYNDARSTGAQWNRWPLYWHTIEQNSDQFDWSAHDPVISADVQNGFLLNAILMGIPGFYFSGSDAIPNTLYEPIFSDGTDTPGPNKTININNKWARYVSAAVNRYKPGGVLAQQQGWANGAGVVHWEMWNEPDLPWFFDGTKNDYARILKVGYLAAKNADQGAVIIFGSMANNFADLDYYKDVLNIFSTDPIAVDNDYFHNIMATHSYFYAWQSWYHVFRARNAMSLYGIDKEIWLNETGIPAWDDYPGPVWDSNSQYRGTTSEQADYMIQSAFYAFFAGADGFFHFQMYDGCGNQPQQTDFPPHNGELCRSDGTLISDPSKPCAGDANGLFTNYTDAACFTHHPNPGSPRENFEAYKILTQYLQDSQPLYRDRVCTKHNQSWISFYRPNTNQRIMAVWACKNNAENAAIPAIDSGAQLLTPDGASTFIAPTDGYYYLTLPGATNDNPVLDPVRYPVGGRPFILIERDLQKPTVTIDASETGSNIFVSWNGDDKSGSGVAAYSVSVSVDGGPFNAWLTNVTSTNATWSGSYNSSVQFRVIARDAGWNWSDPADDLLGTIPVNVAPTVSKTVNRTTAAPSDTLTYQIIVSNPGSTTNSDVHISDVLPNTLEYRNGTLWASTGSPSITGNTITWDGPLNPNQTVTLGFQAYVSTAIINNTTIVNSVSVRDDSGHSLTASASTSVTVNTPTPVPTATNTPTPSPTATPTSTPSVTATPGPSPTPTITPTPPPSGLYKVFLPIVTAP